MGDHWLAAVFPHPDDESLFAGGLLAHCAATGARTRLLCLTLGEGGGSRFGERGRALAERRSQELARACTALGVEHFEQLDLGDGRLAHVPPGALARQVRTWLAREPCQVVVSFGPDGAYGHADHVACGRAVQQAVTALPGATRLLQTAFEPGTFTAARRGLDRFMDAAALPVASEALGAPVQPGELHLDLDDPLVLRKREAVGAHASQLPDGDPDRMLARGLLHSLCIRERYRVAHGPGFATEVARDPFAGLS